MEFNAFFNEFVSTYGATILYTILTAIAGYIGIAVKNLYTKYVNDKTKQDVVKTCVKAIEQLYADLHGAEKLDKCIESVSAMLCEKGITVSELEIRMLIEAAVNEFNGTFGSFHGDADDEGFIGDEEDAKDLLIKVKPQNKKV